MAREIRKVPPNWEHYTIHSPYVTAMEEWIDQHYQWLEYIHPDQHNADNIPEYYAEWFGPPPDPQNYPAEWSEGELTWWQVHALTGSTLGSAVSPPFETQSELVEYLVKNGDYHDQHQRKMGITSVNCDPWTRAEAEELVYGSGRSPSPMVS
jgi:hypothetical protein